MLFAVMSLVGAYPGFRERLAHGLYFDTADSMMAITGGTGAYSGAGGEMRLDPRDATGSAYEFSCRLK